LLAELAARDMQILQLQAALAHAQRRIAELEATVAQQQTRLAEVDTALQQAQDTVSTLSEELAQAQAAAKKPRIKPTTPPPPPKERKKRETNATRPRETPTREVSHAPTVCPVCGRPLTGKATEHRRRQVITIPPAPYEVVEHVICSCHCGHCDQRVMAQPTPEELNVLPRFRVSLDLMAYVTNLAIGHRLPIDQVGLFLERTHGLHLADGEIVKILHRVALAAQDDLERILFDIQQADYLHGDETGWRQNGHNGYIWQLRSQDACYLTFDFGRGSRIPAFFLDECFTGVLVSDFYCGYSPLACRKQRCWVHFLRDLKELALAHPECTAFVQDLRDLYRAATVQSTQPGYADLPEAERIQHRLTFEQRAVDLAAPHCKQPDDAARVLAERLQRFVAELFVFVECPSIPSENNTAERTFRPIVIARKICGGSRSAKGSATKMTLLSLFITWQLRGINPLEAIPRLLLGHSTLSTAA